MKFKFSRSQKLLSYQDFRKIYQDGHRFIGKKILIHYRLGSELQPRLGITISRKWGKACKRNRFKRIVREAYRQIYPKLPSYLELNIHPRKSFEKLSLKDAQEELKCLIKKLYDETQFQSKKSCHHN